MKYDYKRLIERYFEAHEIKPQWMKFICCDGRVALGLLAIDKRNLITTYYIEAGQKRKCQRYFEIELSTTSDKISKFQKFINKIRYTFSFDDEQRRFNNAGKLTEADYRKLYSELKCLLEKSVDGNWKPRFYYHRKYKQYALPIDDYWSFENEADLEMKLALRGF